MDQARQVHSLIALKRSVSGTRCIPQREAQPTDVVVEIVSPMKCVATSRKGEEHYYGGPRTGIMYISLRRVKPGWQVSVVPRAASNARCQHAGESCGVEGGEWGGVGDNSD